MRNVTGWLMAMMLLASGCTFHVQMLTPGTALPELASETPVLTSPVPTVVPTVETPVPTLALPEGPLFYDAFFTLDPATGEKQNLFPVGTKQIYAVWSYENMQAGLNVRRDWYWNEKLWITREEPWDYAKYGASGTVQDVSVYDFEAGFPLGSYTLKIYINNVIRPIGTSTTAQPQNEATFEVQPPGQSSAGNAALDPQ